MRRRTKRRPERRRGSHHLEPVLRPRPGDDGVLGMGKSDRVWLKSWGRSYARQADTIGCIEESLSQMRELGCNRAPNPPNLRRLAESSQSQPLFTKLGPNSRPFKACGNAPRLGLAWIYGVVWGNNACMELLSSHVLVHCSFHRYVRINYNHFVPRRQNDEEAAKFLFTWLVAFPRFTFA